MLTSLQALLRLATLRWLGVFICALAVLLSATSTASALEPAQTKTRVWGFDFAGHNSAGLFRAASSGKHQENQLARAVQASGSPHAARGVGGGAEKTFEILDGVRRAKAAEMAGKTAIEAEVIGTGGKVVEVPLGALRSPKAGIDATGSALSRWLNTLKQTLGGSKPPPILVQPGARGTPIPRVTVDY